MAYAEYFKILINSDAVLPDKLSGSIPGLAGIRLSMAQTKCFAGIIKES